MTYLQIKKQLDSLQNEQRRISNTSFFKTGEGQYSAHDKFLGIRVPELRAVAKNFKRLSQDQLQLLLNSPYNEERLLALIIIEGQYEEANEEKVYRFYKQNLVHVNNWNLVDESAHKILGRYLFNKDKTELYLLAESKLMWERRVAIVSTWYFIRNDHFEDTMRIAEILLNDRHDLIHKASGWMLREVGKRNKAILLEFLNKHSKIMPRTMLRYAIEHLTQEERKKYMGIL